MSKGDSCDKPSYNGSDSKQLRQHPRAFETSQVGLGGRKRPVESYVREQRNFRWMYVADTISLLATMLLITSIRFGTNWPDFSTQSYFVGFFIAIAVHIAVAYFGGLYEREHRLGTSARIGTVTRLSVIAVLIDAALSLGSDKFIMPRANLVIYALVSSVALTFNRWLAKRVMTARFGRPRVLLVGTPDDIELANKHLEETDRDAIVVGQQTTLKDLGLVVDELEASDVLLLGGVELADVYPNPLEYLEAKRVGVYHRLTPVDTLLGVHSARQIAGMPFIEVRSHGLSAPHAHLKRALDLFYLVIGAPLWIPVVAFALAYAGIVAGGPIFYRQRRVGRNGKEFSMLKLRTMYPGSEDKTGPVLAERNDVRVIPAMAWMRSMRFDELPQIWNVIRGDMSLIGPRPERKAMTDNFERLIPGYGRRHDIRPGITGLAQVNGHYHTDPGFKLGYDLHYLVNWTPMLDIQILIQTVWVVLARRV